MYYFCHFHCDRNHLFCYAGYYLKMAPLSILNDCDYVEGGFQLQFFTMYELGDLPCPIFMCLLYQSCHLPSKVLVLVLYIYFLNETFLEYS